MSIRKALGPNAMRALTVAVDRCAAVLAVRGSAISWVEASSADARSGACSAEEVSAPDTEQDAVNTVSVPIHRCLLSGAKKPAGSLLRFNAGTSEPPIWARTFAALKGKR